MPAAGVAIAAGAWSIGNALDGLKNSGLCQVSTSQSARLAFPLVIYLVKYLSTLNSALLQLYQQQKSTKYGNLIELL
ncbi:MAG: hypothetical protein V7K28_16115 [Nostoc sp.]